MPLSHKPNEPYIGRVVGTDKKGNYKVKAWEFEKLVILSESAGFTLSSGAEVEFFVSGYGDYVYFAKNWKIIPENNGSDKKIELLLYDISTDDVLLLGSWKGPSDIMGNRYILNHGHICGRSYIHTKACLPDRYEQENDLAGGLAKQYHVDISIINYGEFSGVDCDSLLQTKISANNQPDRANLESLIKRYLSFNAK